MYLWILAVCSLAYGSTPLETSQFNILGKGWQQFEYGRRETEIHTAFMVIDSHHPVILRITDVSQPGAAFRVLDNGQRVLVTPIPAQDHRKEATSNPWRAYNSNAWSHGHTVLSKGFHHIRVFMRYSPWEMGLGGIMAEPLDICEHKVGRYLVVRNLVDWDMAELLCEELGGNLADLKRPTVTSSKQMRRFSRVLGLVKKCAPENDQVWIGGTVDAAHADEDPFPASIKAVSATEGITGSEWEQTQMGILCRI